jgi:hypothetical protein
VRAGRCAELGVFVDLGHGCAGARGSAMGGQARRRQASGQPSRQSCAASGSFCSSSSTKWGTDDLGVAGRSARGARLRAASAPPRSGPRGSLLARVKTDAVDARTLAHLLRADLLPEAYVAPRELRDQRDLLRQRVVLPDALGTQEPRPGLDRLAGHPRAHADLFGVGGLRFLDDLPLRPDLRARLEVLLRLIADFDLLGTAALEAVVSQQILRRGAAISALLAPEEKRVQPETSRITSGRSGAG